MKGKTRIIVKFLRTDSVICSHSREGETPSYSRINRVYMNMHSKHVIGVTMYFTQPNNYTYISNIVSINM